MTMGDRVAVMRRGELQQVGAPQQLYDRPVNLFVGGFIGSPAMNMFEATLEPNGTSLAVVVGSRRIALADDKLSAHPALHEYVGRKVILGVRPEDLEDAALAVDTPQDRRLAGRVVLREALGSEIVVHLDIDARPALTDDVRELAADSGAELGDQAPHGSIVGRFDPRSAVREGQLAEVAVDTRALHFFDPDTGAGIYETAREAVSV
jgi:multiple sugar transport system ATP-binding protein